MSTGKVHTTNARPFKQQSQEEARKEFEEKRLKGEIKARGDKKEQRGSFAAKQHWQQVEKYCDTVGSMEPECIDAWYAALERENWLEWGLSLKKWFWNQPWIALFGWVFTVMSWYYAVDLVIWPNKLPSINDAPWKDIDMWRALEIMGLTSVANIVQPNWFFLSQMFTLGDSDLADLELIYMTPPEASMYFVLEALYLPWIQLPAMLFCVFFWWLYAAEFVWFTFEFWLFVFSGQWAEYEESGSVEVFYTAKLTPEEEDATLKDIIDKYWVKYDTDNSGELSKAEAMIMCEDILEDYFKQIIQYNRPKTQEDEDFEKKQFEKAYNDLFKRFDENTDDSLTKEEMLPFVRLLMQYGIYSKEYGLYPNPAYPTQ